MSGLLEPRLDPAACTDAYNVYQLCEPGGGGGASNVHPPLYLPKRYSELTFTTLGRDARELLFSAYDDVTRDYVVVELVRSVDAVGGAWLLANFELVVLLLRTRLRHQTLLRVLDVWTPPLPVATASPPPADAQSAGGGELRSFAVAYECARQQLSYYLVPYLLLKQTMPHWRLSNMLYQIVWAAHHLHFSCGRMRLNNVWDVPFNGFLYDDDTCAVKLNLKLLVTAARRSGAGGVGSGGVGADSRDLCDDGPDGGEERAAVRDLGRMIVRHLVATVFGTLDVGVHLLAAPQALLDRLLAELRFTCDGGSGCCEQLFEHWVEATRAAGLADPDRQTALLKDFLAQLLLGTADGSDRCSHRAAAGIVAATFAGVLSHPYVSAWREEGDLDYEVDTELVADLDLVRRNGCCHRGGGSGSQSRDGDGSGSGRREERSTPAVAALSEAGGWELPLHSLMTAENRLFMLREIKRFEHAHPHHVRSLVDLCVYHLAAGSGQQVPSSWSFLPPSLASRVRDVHRRLFLCGPA